VENGTEVTLPETLDVRGALAFGDKLARLPESASYVFNFGDMGRVEPFGLLITSDVIDRFRQSRPTARYKAKVGQLASEVEIFGATMMDDGLLYQVKAAPRYPTGAPVKRWIAARFVEQSANSTEWEYGTWDTELEEYVTEEETDL
jgi:hypothetical protein